MFHSARIKLTAWYLLILIIISGLFSLAFYAVATREVEDVIRHIERRQEFEGFNPPPPGPVLITLEALNASKERLRNQLLIANGIILFIAGSASYFLAGRTLRPIKLMIDEQNQFISSASHELRTPIATLRAEMEGNLLEKNISDIAARNLIKSNLEELGTLQELTNNLLRVAQVHDINSSKSMENISLSEVVQPAKKKVLPLAKKKTINISTSLKEVVIRGDKSGLTEVFVILLDNAIKYSPKNSAIKVISKKQNNSVIVSVIDEGIGIPPKDLPHIFERFYRSDKSRTGTEGYGLGLSIAKKIMQSHEGSITVKSKEGKGSVFILHFPQTS